MGQIYESENGSVFMGLLTGFRVHIAGQPRKRRMPPWLKTRSAYLYDQLKKAGHDPSSDSGAGSLLWEYVLEAMAGTPGGLREQAAEIEPASDVLEQMMMVLARNA